MLLTGTAEYSGLVRHGVEMAVVLAFYIGLSSFRASVQEAFSYDSPVEGCWH